MYGIKSLYHPIYAVFLGLCVLLSVPVYSAPDEQQLSALSDIYANLNGAGWTTNTGWESATDPCTGWHGVTCDESGTTITELDLSRNNLQGSIPETISALTGLTLLNLETNSLGGSSIPASIGDLSKLIELYLNDTGLQGVIPVEMGQLSELQSLVLDDNLLNGAIPDELGNLTQLIDIRLYGNRLRGNIPESFGNLTGLKNLALQRNLLSGIIPSSLVNLNLLNTVNLDWNALHSSDGTLNSFINQRLSNTETNNYIDTQTLDAATRAPDIGESMARLNWDQRNTTPATEGGYKIYRSTSSNGEYTFVKKVPLKQSNSTLVENLSPGSTYYFQVRSYTSENIKHDIPIDLDSSGLFYSPLEITTLSAGSGNEGIDTTPDPQEPSDSGNGSSDGGSGSSGGGGGGSGGTTYFLLALFGLWVLRRTNDRDTKKSF